MDCVTLEMLLKMHLLPGGVVHTCNPSMREAEAEQSQKEVQAPVSPPQKTMAF
jgi:hypothetical protein